MRAFEIQTYSAGKWKIDSVFDDRDLAVFEAQRIDDSNRYAAVRVVEESFDEKTQKTESKTIFRGGRIEQVAAAPSKPAPAKRAAKPAAPRKRKTEPVRRSAARPPAAKQKSNGTLVALLAIILVAGVAAMIALKVLPAYI